MVRISGKELNEVVWCITYFMWSLFISIGLFFWMYILVLSSRHTKIALNKPYPLSFLLLVFFQCTVQDTYLQRGTKCKEIIFAHYSEVRNLRNEIYWVFVKEHDSLILLPLACLLKCLHHLLRERSLASGLMCCS